ncbi:MAG: hypothetical protein ABR592_11070 [Nitriliruptorales bacterium]
MGAAFRLAVPLAALAFVLSWLLEEIPLRTAAHVAVGDGVADAQGAAAVVDAVPAPGSSPRPAFPVVTSVRGRRAR